ncbi:MAG: ABC-type nickel/cobalt efflux system permease component RcnA [Cellvibrionaceae bacterium]|jgi:ABC-type nickel/cobalt efflux system permease component RcnA
MLVEWMPLILLGFGLGLLHALDADHIMAVSALANQNPSIKRTLVFSLHWALGHGGVLLACGLVFFGLGVAIPSGFQTLAEIMVGVLLIILGFRFFWRFRRLNITLVQHSHDDVVHTHWSTETHAHSKIEKHVNHEKKKEKMMKIHQPVMIGVLHGMAGSAPALALIPAVASGQLSVALTYLIIFSLGVVLSMLAFGLGFSWIQQYLFQYYQRAFTVCRHGIALVAVVVGVFLLIKTI